MNGVRFVKYKLGLIAGLIRGYYYPSRRYGLSRIGACWNATRLTCWCLEDNREAPRWLLRLIGGKRPTLDLSSWHKERS